MTETPATEIHTVTPFVGIEDWKTNHSFYQRALQVGAASGAKLAHVCFSLLVEREICRNSKTPRQAMMDVLDGLERFAKYHGSTTDQEVAVRMYRVGTKLPILDDPYRPRRTSALPSAAGEIVVRFMTREDLAAEGARKRAARRAEQRTAPSAAPTPPAG